MNTYCKNCKSYQDGEMTVSGMTKCTEGNVVTPGTRGCHKFNRVSRRPKPERRRKRCRSI